MCWSGVSDDERVAKTMDKLSVNFGVEILTLVKGYVSTEVDARLSFDTDATLERARNIIALYEAAGENRRTEEIAFSGKFRNVALCLFGTDEIWYHTEEFCTHVSDGVPSEEALL